ncbi:lysis protein [Pseudomonas sp. MDT1-17]
MSPAALKLAVQFGLALLLVLLSAGATWQVQDWRYGLQLEKQSGLHQDDLTAIGNAAAAQVRADQDQRLALEQRLSVSEQIHYKELSNAQHNQARLRDRLATADLRLSVLLDSTDPASGCSVPAGTAAGGVVHGGTRARLDPAHAQRIVAITDAGDQGLIALAACQAYVREVSH